MGRPSSLFARTTVCVVSVLWAMGPVHGQLTNTGQPSLVGVNIRPVCRRSQLALLLRPLAESEARSFDDAGLGSPGGEAVET